MLIIAQIYYYIMNPPNIKRKIKGSNEPFMILGLIPPHNYIVAIAGLLLAFSSLFRVSKQYPKAS